MGSFAEFTLSVAEELRMTIEKKEQDDNRDESRMTIETRAG